MDSPPTLAVLPNSPATDHYPSGFTRIRSPSKVFVLTRYGPVIWTAGNVSARVPGGQLGDQRRVASIGCPPPLSGLTSTGCVPRWPRCTACRQPTGRLSRWRMWPGLTRADVALEQWSGPWSCCSPPATSGCLDGRRGITCWQSGASSSELFCTRQSTRAEKVIGSISIGGYENGL